MFKKLEPSLNKGIQINLFEGESNAYIKINKCKEIDA